MILGLGTDIIEIERIRKSIDQKGKHFIDRLFTAKEQDYCFKYIDPMPHFAVRFAAKEAVVKAFGTGFGKHISWQDIEIFNEENGRPIVRFSENILKRFQNPQMILSMSHSQLYAVATAIWYP